MGLVSIKLQPEIESPLENLAEKLDISKNYIINQAIKEYLERKGIADQKWSETLEALDSVKSGCTFEEEEVHKWLESWGSNKELKPPKI